MRKRSQGRDITRVMIEDYKIWLRNEHVVKGRNREEPDTMGDINLFIGTFLSLFRNSQESIG